LSAGPVEAGASGRGHDRRDVEVVFSIQVRDISRLPELIHAQGHDALLSDGTEPRQRRGVAVKDGDERRRGCKRGQQSLHV
jgi:hypothetical protein